MQYSWRSHWETWANMMEVCCMQLSRALLHNMHPMCFIAWAVKWNSFSWRSVNLLNICDFRFLYIDVSIYTTILCACMIVFHFSVNECSCYVHVTYVCMCPLYASLPASRNRSTSYYYPEGCLSVHCLIRYTYMETQCDPNSWDPTPWILCETCTVAVSELKYSMQFLNFSTSI